MRKNVSGYIQFMILAVAFSACKNVPVENIQEVFIQNGKPTNVIQSGGIWENDGQKLNGSGVNNYLLAGKILEEGDFDVSVRLSLDSLNFSAASLVFGENHFGFDARSTPGSGKSALFVEGPLFGKNIIIPGTEDKIKAGIPFDASLTVRGKELSLSIDGEKVFVQNILNSPVGNLALRPWRNTMRVLDFKASGKFVKLTQLNYLFESGTNGYNTYRIPAIVTSKNGTILAFAEGRKNTSSDTGDIDLVLKRSIDNGKSWSDISVVWNDSQNVCGNPAPVVDFTTGTIWLLSTWNLGSDHESDIINQTSKDSRRVFVLYSTDDGITWSTPKEITPEVKQKDWTWYATGPCHGIQLENSNLKGRLVIPCDHIEAYTNKYFSHTVYSDDHGKTWQLGGTTPQDQVNECTIAELSDGKLMLNMRNYDRTQKSRKISLSTDGGISWGNIFADKVLIEPICQGSLLTHTFADKGSGKILFLNPANESSRANMTLRLSVDEGNSWVKSRVLYSGSSAYSDLTKLENGNIGCFYEAGYFTPYQGIVFNEVSMAELENQP